MKINTLECDYGTACLFSDFFNYQTVDAYLSAVLDTLDNPDESEKPHPEYVPVNCAVRDINTGEMRWLVKCGHPSNSVDQHLRWVKSLPANLRRFVSGRIMITGNIPEKELFFCFDR